MPTIVREIANVACKPLFRQCESCGWDLGPAEFLCPLRLRPDGARCPLPVAAQHQLDVRIAVLATNEALGQIVHSPGVIESGDGDLAIGVTMQIVPREVWLAADIVRAANGVGIADDIHVAADTNVFNANQFHGVVEVIERVFDGDGLFIPA